MSYTSVGVVIGRRMVVTCVTIIGGIAVDGTSGRRSVCVSIGL